MSEEITIEKNDKRTFWSMHIQRCIEIHMKQQVYCTQAGISYAMFAKWKSALFPKPKIEYGLTWLASAPKIKLLSEHDARKPYPLDWAEQERFFDVLPSHLQEIAIFAVNTGCRDQEICKLRWSWEVKVPIDDMKSVFIIPGDNTKNGDDRIVVLNRTARSVIERQRGKHQEFVFVYKGKPLTRIMNTAWKKARKKANLSTVRVHDLKHTFGRRLRSAGELRR